MTPLLPGGIERSGRNRALDNLAPLLGGGIGPLLLCHLHHGGFALLGAA